jgi:hypothetical protein
MVLNLWKGESMPALAVFSPEDYTLATIAALTLASTRSTALVIDLDSRQHRWCDGQSLRCLIEEGPTGSDLHPVRSGVALVGNGGIEPYEASEVLEALIAGWEDVILVLPHDLEVPVPIVPVRPHADPTLLVPFTRPAVYVKSGWTGPTATPGPIVRRPRAAAIQRLMGGGLPVPGRWIRDWSAVWGMPWR